MSLRSLFALFALVLFSVQIACAQKNPAYHPVESEHVAGPHGLEGWTLDSPLPDGQYDGERMPFTLVIARNGKVLRKIDGNAFIWHWIFWNGGQQVAYESGPLHFSLQCELYDLKTGRVLESVDCWQGIPDNSPAWLAALEKPH
jgi:hypothetical protein